MTESRSSLFDAIRSYASRFSGHTGGRTLRVLIVDDEEPIRRFVERVLREAGYQTATASDGPEAIVAAHAFQPIDVLLTDVMMPQMAGDELARRLRQTEPGLKVLYLTGFSDTLFKERLTLWEDEAFLDKPCTITGLLQALALLSHGCLEAPPARPGARSGRTTSSAAI